MILGRQLRLTVIVSGAAMALVSATGKTLAEEAPVDGVVSGHVYLPDGVTPAVGARVFLEAARPTAPDGNSNPTRTQPASVRHGRLNEAPRTRDDGSFEVPIRTGRPNAQPGVYVVRVDLDGYAPLRSDDVTPGQTVKLTLIAGERLRGIVAGPDDEPLAGARVAAYWPSYRRGGMRPDGAGHVASAQTGPDGRYDLGPIAPGQYDVWATAPEMAPVGQRDVRIVAGRPVELDLFLPRPAELRGTVVYAGTTDPVEGVVVVIHLLEPAERYMATTGADGTFRLVGLPKGEHVVNLRKGSPWRAQGIEMRNAAGRYNADGTITILSGEVIIREILAPRRLTVDLAEGEVVDLTVEMSAGGSIEGRAIAADGSPLEGASVDLVRKGRVPEWDAEGEITTGNVATTDVDGRFRLGYLWSDNYLVKIRDKAGRRGASEWVTVENGDVTEIEVVTRVP